MAIFDAAGRRVAVLLKDQQMPAGTHDVSWEAAAHTSAGIYFARMEFGGERLSRKLLVLH
jgi:hypothetical protein